MKADSLREKFLLFFKTKKHKIIESDSLVPQDDPTVLFTPAGMNQFKKQFLGFDARLRRAATAQRCLRTDDLEKVGKTTGHHTFFEMLGNFSFGDYFKTEAITWAWEFLTGELSMDSKKLWVSVYKDDQEAYQIWQEKIKVPVQKIVRLGDRENFWPSEARLKGPNGPCGPCSEIFYDLGKDRGGHKSDCRPGCGCGRFIEIWNLVFTQFNRKETGLLEPLPQKNIDTGMGLERLAAVMQGVSNNFETDLFQPLIKEITTAVKTDPKDKKTLIYAVADHLRAIVFAIYDGVLPSNENRGYVVRKLIRKSVLHLKALGINKPFLYKIVPILAAMMKVPYPELSNRRENISEVILAEEKNFITTIGSSEAIWREKLPTSILISTAKTGGVAFQLYDTYGIPTELTLAYLKKQGVKNLPGIVEAVNAKLKEQKTRSKIKSTMKGEVFNFKDLGLKVKETKFYGYTDCQTKAKILKIIRDNVIVEKIAAGAEAQVVLDKSVFYAEAGGQIGDSGELRKGKNIFSITDTRRYDNAILHIGRVKEGNFKTKEEILAVVDSKRRLAIARNHTATHLLQAALRKVLGAHIQQRGSLVAEDRLRFDFTHFRALSREEISRVEDCVNNYILENHTLDKQEMAVGRAKKSGALAFFAEKYAARVRVVSINNVSKELCAGTHLQSTGQIGLFKIIQEGSVASGVRRIEAQTGKFAYQSAKEEDEIIKNLASLLAVPKEKINQEIEKRLSRIKELERQLGSQKTDVALAVAEDLIQNAAQVSGIKLITHLEKKCDLHWLRKSVDLIKVKTKTSVIALAGSDNRKVFLVIGVSQDLCDRGIDAAKLIKEVAAEIGGSGGGRKDFAQAGGNQPENIMQAFEKLKNILSQIKL